MMTKGANVLIASTSASSGAETSCSLSRQLLHRLPTLKEEEEALKLGHVVVNDERLDIGRTLLGWSTQGGGQIVSLRAC